MSQADDIYEEEEGLVLFGIAMSPTILGVILAVLGIGGAVWLGLNLVRPALDERTQLAEDIQAKEDKLSQQGDIQAKIDAARSELEVARETQRDVLGMFASKDSLSTLLLDLNQQVEQRNAQLNATPLPQRLSSRNCPAYVVENFQAVSNRADGFFATAALTGFEPIVLDANSANANAAAIADDGLELVQDGSLGSGANGQIKRQTYTVSFEGSFVQTQEIFRQLERLQPLLLVKDVEMSVQGRPILFGNAQPLDNCQPDLSLETEFTLQALLPLSTDELLEQAAAEAAAAAAEGEDGQPPAQ